MGLMGTFLSWLLIKDDNNRTIERSVPDVSYWNFIPDERVLNGTPFFRPSMKYVRNLQYCYEQLKDNQGRHLMFDADKMREQYRQLHEHAVQLEHSLAIARGECQALRLQLNAALEWQTAGGQKNQVLTENGYDPIEFKDQPRNGHLFATEDGSDGKKKKKVAAAMKEYGFSNQDIADTIKVKLDSVGPYISEARKHYELLKYADGEIALKWDEKWGSDISHPSKMFEGMWEYVDLETNTKKPDFTIEGDFTPLSQDMGTIHHGLQNPIKYG